MEFLTQTKPKVVRTVLYGDQEFNGFELELLHTPIFQRLYDLKQLGYADRIFPDAVHSRFNHLIGLTEVAGKMADHLCKWLERHNETIFNYADQKSGANWSEESINGEKLCELVRSKRSVLRLMALLHDLTHAAFGHTLEDEVSVFKEKHDDPKRQTRFFDTLVAQLITLWAVELDMRDVDMLELDGLSEFIVDRERIVKLAEAVHGALPASERTLFSSNLLDLDLAFRFLLTLEEAHIKDDESKTALSHLHQGINADLLVAQILVRLNGHAHKPDLVIHRDLFLIDMVGNTICADLIDYARRDTANANLRVSFDDRLLRYLCLVSVDDKDLVPDGRRAIRTALQVFTDKLRLDVLSEMSMLLKARYLITERITLHPTKCAAGACLGTAVQLLGVEDLPPWAQGLGDSVFLALLMRSASAVEKYCSKAAAVATQGELSKGGERDLLLPINDAEKAQELLMSLWPVEPLFCEFLLGCIVHLNSFFASKGKTRFEEIRLSARAARRILLKLNARRYPKLAYRLHGKLSTGSINTARLAKQYSDPRARFQLERSIEISCNLPLGSIHIHCPRRTTSLKVAEALVVGNDLERVSHLRTVTRIYHDASELEPYEQEIKAVENMYESIWRLSVYVDIASADKIEVIALAVTRTLGLPNDPLLENEPEDGGRPAENVYSILARREKEFALTDLSLVVRELDTGRANYRLRDKNIVPVDLNAIVTKAIAEARQGKGD